MSNRQVGERSKTNVSALYFCIGFVVILFCFVGYTFFTGSVYRVINGYDNCGNVCGRKNEENSLAFCGSTDKTDEKFQMLKFTPNPDQKNLTDVDKTCVKKCEDRRGFKTVGNRCFEFKNNGTEAEDDISGASIIQIITEDLASSWVGILVACFVALVFSYVILILFRYAIKYVIWVIYISIIILFTVGSIALLVGYFNASKSTDEHERESATVFLVVSIIFGIVAIVIAVLLYVFRKRIRLVIQLFKEASKALGDVPLIVAEPLLTFLALMATFVVFILFVIIIEGSGRLELVNGETFTKADYVKDPGMVTAHVVNLIAFLWFTQFILGCQHFVIASTVSDWFFARSKDKLDSPISRGFSNLINFHLGSVCLGSIVLTIVAIIRMIVNGIRNSLRNSDNAFARIVATCCDCLVQMLEEFLQYLVRNAYIIVAKDGTPLLTSGKRAVSLLSKNLIDVIALNQIGDFVLFLARVFVVLIAGFVGYEIIGNKQTVQLPFIPILIAIIFAFFIIHCFMTVYEMTLDTIFVCFCEDCEENDGMERPYFMSKGLMEVMQELKQQAGGEFNFGGPGNVEGGGGRPMLQPNYYNNN